MTNSVFDIVIPTHNRANLLGRAIESVINQTIDKFNLYILDNNSNDNTLEVAQKYLSNKVHYIKNNENIGMIRNWQKGLFDIGTSKYSVLLSDDDELCSDFIQKALEAIKKYPDLGLYTSAVYVNRLNQVNTWKSEYLSDNIKSEFIEFLPSENLSLYLGGNPISPAAIVVNKKVRNSLWDLDYTDSTCWGFDRYMWGQIALRNSVVYCTIPTAIYYQHELSESANLSKNKFEVTVQSMRVTASLCNVALLHNLIPMAKLEVEISKLMKNAQIELICSLILFGSKQLYHFALKYFNTNRMLLTSELSNTNRIICNIVGIKKYAYLKMYKSRS